MKIVIFLSFLLYSISTFSQNAKVIINDIEFDFSTTSVKDKADLEFVTVYRNNEKLLTHILSKSDGDCSSETIELGAYQITDSTIIFYSYWASGDRQGSNLLPYGFRKQIFNVHNNGEVSLAFSALYIESYDDKFERHAGMKFLFTKPETEMDRKLLADYISKMESIYKGKFVSGKCKAHLSKDIYRVMKKEIRAGTKNWDSIFGENANK